MKPDFDDHVSGQELEEQIDDAILFTMMTEEENNKQMHFTPHTSRRKSGTISSFGAFLYTIASLLLACLVVGALGMSGTPAALPSLFIIKSQSFVFSPQQRQTWSLRGNSKYM